MYNKEILNRVIHSLSKKEIQSFLQFHDKGKEKAFVSLFKIILDKPDIDDATIAKKMAKKGVKNLIKLKTYLFEKLMQSVCFFDPGYSSGHEIRMSIHQAYFFLDKMLLDLTWDLTKKSIKLIKNYELYNHTSDILNLTIQLSEHQHLSTKELRETQIFITDSLKKLDYQNRIDNLNIQSETAITFCLNASTKDDKDLTQKHLFRLMEEINNLPPQIELISATVMQNWMIYKLYYTVKMYKEATDYLSKAVEIYLKNPDYTKGHKSKYLDDLISYGIVSLKSGNYKHFLYSSELFENASDQLYNGNHKIWNVLSKVIKYRKKMHYEDAWETLEGYKEFNESDDNIAPELNILLLLNAATTCFALKRFRKLTSILNRIHPFTKHKKYEHLFLLIETIRLLSHYEQNHLDQCDYKIKSIKRYLKLKKVDNWLRIAFEALESVIRLDLIGFDNQLLKSQVLKDARDQMEKHHSNEILSDFPFNLYLEAKIQDLTMLQLKSK